MRDGGGFEPREVCLECAASPLDALARGIRLGLREAPHQHEPRDLETARTEDERKQAAQNEGSRAHAIAPDRRLEGSVPRNLSRLPRPMRCGAHL